MHGRGSTRLRWSRHLNGGVASYAIVIWFGFSAAGAPAVAAIGSDRAGRDGARAGTETGRRPSERGAEDSRRPEVGLQSRSEMVSFGAVANPVAATFCRLEPDRAAAVCVTALELQPSASPWWVVNLAEHLDFQAEVHGTDPWVSLAIGMQESSLRSDSIGPTGDAGTFQFHPATARAHGVDLSRLRDLSYEVEQHVRLLKQKMATCSGTRNEWSCYHSTTPARRHEYERLVSRYMRR